VAKIVRFALPLVPRAQVTTAFPRLSIEAEGTCTVIGSWTTPETSVGFDHVPRGERTLASIALSPVREPDHRTAHAVTARPPGASPNASA
jgi:hypothetical protein